MILRRFILHIQDQNWFAVGLDVLVVIVGIFLGMQVTEWNDERKQSQLEAQYLVLLQRDLESINASLQAQLDHEQRVISIAPVALDYINELDNQVVVDVAKLGTFLTQIWGRRTLSLQSPIFTELTSTGRVAIIQDSELRNRIVGYFQILDRTELIVDKNNSYVVEAYTAYLRDTGIGVFPLSGELCGQTDQSIQCRFSKQFTDVFGDRKTHSLDTIVNGAPSVDFVNTLRSHLAHRTMASVSTQNRVKITSDETNAISALIRDYQLRAE